MEDLDEIWMKPKCVTIIRLLYEDMTTAILNNDLEMECFSIKARVKQGCMTTLTFSICNEERRREKNIWGRIFGQNPGPNWSQSKDTAKSSPKQVPPAASLEQCPGPSWAE